jgi:class 3 adenylate cyclase
MDERFEEYLAEYAHENDGSKRKQIEDRVWKEFGSTLAILVMDLSRFSTLTERYGIIHNLAMVRRMQLAARPVIEAAGGTVVKFEADNGFAMFNHVLPAIKAAIAVNTAFQELNAGAQDEFKISVGIGIDYGEVLLIGRSDYFGMTVNRASKLGEDVAAADEILISEAALNQLPSDSGIRAEPLRLSISGLSLNAFIIKY